MRSHTEYPDPALLHGGFIASVEGMRALAVLVVLLFHLQVPGFAGGYLGVDLFFVISGFIITRNILYDNGRGEFRLGNFYVRRFRRLFPALLVTVLLTMVGAFYLLPPLALAGTAKSAVFSLLSVANFNFWLEAGYFDADAHSKPLLHTWSLSVEEQFYLLWPALLLFLLRTNWKNLGIVCLLGLSVALTAAGMSSMPDAVFYLLPFRVHQLMAGALVAMIAISMSGRGAALVGGFAGAGFVLLATVLDGVFSPGGNALAVSLFGALLLLCREGGAVNALFASAPMQWIGKRSYAIYLVHWPLIVLYSYTVQFTLTALDRVWLAVATLAVSALLHTAIEKPFRKRGEDSAVLQRAATPMFLTLLVVCVGGSALTWQQGGFPGRFDSGITRIVDSVDGEMKLRRKAIRWGVCNLHREHTFQHYDSRRCATPDPDGPDALVIGDSMAADIYMLLASAYPQVHFMQATAGGCTALLDLDPKNRYPACAALNELRFGELLKRDVDLVILASIWTPQRTARLAATVRYLRERGVPVLVIGPRPVFPGFLPLLVSAQESTHGLNESLSAQIRRKDDLLHSMRDALPGVDIIDMSDVQCDPECDALDGERLLYFDAQHFTVRGAEVMGERLAKKLDLRAYIEEKRGADSTPARLPE